MMEVQVPDPDMLTRGFRQTERYEEKGHIRETCMSFEKQRMCFRGWVKVITCNQLLLPYKRSDLEESSLVFAADCA